MGRCANCRKKTHFGMVCKWCDLDHCVSCMQTEIHQCKGADLMIKQQHGLFKNKLLSEKTVSEKVIKI